MKIAIVWLSALGVVDDIAQAERTSFVATLFIKLVVVPRYVRISPVCGGE